MAVDPGRRDWAAQAEAVLRRLRDIEYASITTEGDDVKEVHVVARSTRTPKQIVRDVESALHAYLQKRIDHRVISVVLERDDAQETPPGGRRWATASKPPRREEPPAREAPADRATEAPPERERIAEPFVPRTADPYVERGGDRGGERRAPRGPEAETERARERVRFVSANLYVSGLRTQAQVELGWRGTTRAGSATGVSMRDSATRLVAAATLQALQPYLGERRALAVDEVVRLRVGRRSVVVVTVKLLEGRSERVLTGSCTVEQDLPQSVVYATLAAVNRILGGMPLREPVEYELRPASA